MRLVLRDLVRMVDFAVVDAAGVAIERKAEQGFGHHRAFEMPTRRAADPRRLPFHLALLARGRLPPDREVRWVALAVVAIAGHFSLLDPCARTAGVTTHHTWC